MLLQLLAAMGVERLDRGERQKRAETERDVRRAPDFRAGGIDRQRQALSAERLGAGNRVPSGRGPALIGIRPAGGRDHLVVLELDAVFVADPIERRQHVAGEFAGFLQHGRGDVAVKIAVMAGCNGGLEARAVIEGQQDVVDRRAVGHGVTPDGTIGRRLPTKPVASQLSQEGNWAAPRRGARPFRPGRRRNVTLLLDGPNRPGRFRRKSSLGLLKWPNSPYRPALSENRVRRQASAPSGIGLLGRSQAVRQRILIPPFGGSIPPAPAS